MVYRWRASYLFYVTALFFGEIQLKAEAGRESKGHACVLLFSNFTLDNKWAVRQTSLLGEKRNSKLKQ